MILRENKQPAIHQDIPGMNGVDHQPLIDALVMNTHKIDQLITSNFQVIHKKIDVIATVKRDADGKMTSIIITNSTLLTG